MLQIVFADFEIAAAQKYANLAELEKCCQTHIFLQNFVLIQPRTSLPKICKSCKILLIILILLIFPIGSRQQQGSAMPPTERRPGLIVHRPFYGAGASHASPAVAARQRRLGRHMHATVTAVWRHAMFFVTLT